MRPCAYLEGYHFKVITDHIALKLLNNIESPSGRIARWALELQQYDFEISYRKGQLNIVADALSRQPLQETSRRVSVEDDEQPREQQGCRLLEEMQGNMKQQPQKFPDYLEEDGKLYRHIPHRAGNEEVASWKMCVPIGQRQRVMTENHDHDSHPA
ncbi:GD17730 [Drosophila simulans]|uniref:GD17730 n=1 Tax=Drosophila simulans TaxID=7240 RepID=B4NSW9_DROSI|nr:GD17730 [Drosophila simulans]